MPSAADLPRLKATRLQTAELSEIDYLLGVDDISRIGAIRLLDPDTGAFLRTVEDDQRATPALLELAQLMAASRAVELNKETEADLRYLRGRGTSVGGMRPKCTVVDDDGHLAIGKFPSVKDDRCVTRGEVLALHLAAKAGISVAAVPGSDV
jgi:serine/threonine-protein kinase HipA